ncbi:MAG TPA: alpha-amylase [Bacteroidales bacterium]|nr:alpha-amylase [Bacteroidales bacterium]
MNRANIKLLSLVAITIMFVACNPTIKTDTATDIPEWSQQAVWYQIFPERFSNGDDGNNPTAENIKAPDGWEIHDWTSDWYERTEWEINAADNFYWTVRKRRYGGDLQGVINKLDYLKDLGITAIYFNPIFDARTEHKYDASFYHHIDRFFGSDPSGDEAIFAKETHNDPTTWEWTSADKLFLELIEEAHKRGIHIVIDGVFNHTGPEFWAFADIVKNQEKSEYKDWYDIISFDNPETPDVNEFDFKGWAGYKGLPEFKEKDGNIVEPARKHIFDITRRWMDPNGDGDPSDGIDGWRLDVAFDVGHGFWHEWTDLVRSINSKAYITAEIWEREQAMEYINEDECDAVMNYPFLRAVHEFLIRQSISAETFDSALRVVRDAYPKEVNLAMMNLMGSHDTERLASMIVNDTNKFKAGTKLGERRNLDYSVEAPTKANIEVQKLVALFQYTYIGSPMVYYGDESGVWGADDPDDRKPMIWPEFEYDDETNHPFGKEVKASKVAFNSHLHAWYKKIAAIRNSNKSLQLGDYKTLYTNNKEKIFVFERRYEDEIAIVGFNRSNEAVEVTIETAEANKVFKEVLQGLEYKIVDGKITFNIRPVSGIVLVN